MWSPSAPLLRVGLSAHTLSIARVPRFGFGLGMGLKRQTQVEYLPVRSRVRAEHEPWRPAVECLAQWLQQHKGHRFRLQVQLSGRWTRWQLVPWRAELSKAAEHTAYAALRFRETYGPSAQHWHVLPARLAPGRMAPATAVDAALLEALQAVCRDAGCQLLSLSPYFSSAFDYWRGHLAGPQFWFATLEPDTVTLGLHRGGQWTALQTQRLQVPRKGEDQEAEHWQEGLLSLQSQMALACEVRTEGVPLYLAGGPPRHDQASGHMPLSDPGAQSDLRWLNPRPLLERAPPGLRLVMGR